MSTAIAQVKNDTPQQLKTPISFGSNGVKLSSFEDAYRFAVAVVKSGFAPKGFETPEAVLIAIQHGAELGLPPMAALQNIAVINGRPGIFGDAALALVRSKDVLEYHREEMIGTEGKDDWGCRVTTKRKGDAEAIETFTVADAKRASLWGKAGPWTQYPKRMLRFRARGFSLRDNYGDVLKGLRTVEELLDTPPEPNVRPTMAQILGPTTTQATSPENSSVVTTNPTPPPAEYTDAQRKQFIKEMEDYILDAKVSPKVLAAELIAAGITIEEGFEMTEQPTTTLGQIAAYVGAKVKEGVGA